jgi:hypothetical protein
MIPTVLTAPTAQLGDSKQPSKSTFNYLNHVVKPQDVKESDNIFSVVFNIRDALDYGKASLINGYDCKGKNLILGDRYFLKSGKCNSEASVDQCKGQDRYVYIDNVPMNFSPCVDVTQPISQRCRTNQNSGLIPGVIQDTMQINPFELISSIAGKGSVINDKCVLRTEKVGWQSGKEQNFIYETRCAAEPKPLVCGFTTVTEHFTGDDSSSSLSNSSIIVLLITLLLSIICILLFYQLLV